MSYNVALIPGDGIGPEIVESGSSGSGYCGKEVWVHAELY